MKTEFKVLGIDVSKANITTHTLSCFPNGGIKNYWNKTRNKTKLYPTFFATPDKKKKQQNAFDFASYVKEITPDYAVLEPTGNHYSRIWYQILQSLGVRVLWVGHVELKRYRAGKLLPNKSDEADALAMSAYILDPEHLTEVGGINPKFYLIHQPEPINQLRDLCQQLEHLARVQSPIINYSRQLLSWQFPEVANRKSNTQKRGSVPPLWGWLAKRIIYPVQQTVLNNKFENSIAKQYGIEPDYNLRQHANWLCDISLFEQDIEAEIQQILSDSCFRKYIQVFDEFGFGLRIRARLLTRVYPFEAFLIKGKPFIEHEMKGKRRVKYNRTRNSFKMRLGMGTITEQSGDMLITKTGGSSICRMSLWLYVLTLVEPGNLPNTDVGRKLLEHRDLIKKSQVKLKGKHVQSKLMSKTCNLLYQELVKRLV